MNFLLVACIFISWGLVVATCKNPPVQSPAPLVQATAPAPAPAAVECGTLIFNMVDCLSFFINGGNETAPAKSCCLGFKAVVETDVECICEALKSSADLGIDINVTKAMTLPSACRISAASLSICHVSSAPSAPPANPPKESTPPPKANNPPAAPLLAPPTTNSPPPAATSTGGGAPPVEAPAPSPADSRAYTISTSFALLFSMALASFLAS